MEGDREEGQLTRMEKEERNGMDSARTGVKTFEVLHTSLQTMITFRCNTFESTNIFNIGIHKIKGE